MLAVLLNNRVHDSVGGQPPAATQPADGGFEFTAVAAAAGYQTYGVAGTADEWSSMLLSLFFLVCASSWLCKQVRDRADVNNEMWEKVVQARARHGRLMLMRAMRMMTRM